MDGIEHLRRRRSVLTRPAEYGALRNLFRALTCAPIDEEVGRQAGAYLHSDTGGAMASKS